MSFVKGEKLIAITGGCGFIGANLARHLANRGYAVTVIDSLVPVYNSSLAILRKKMLESHPNIRIIHGDLNSISHNDLRKILSDCSNIFHFAAFPGVKQSLLYPDAYLKNNVNAFSKVISVSMDLEIDRFFMASSSSVYGENYKIRAISESEANGSNLKSFYAETKWSNELMAKDFAQRSNFPIIALRFFTVFGPWGRPDMSYWQFAKSLEFKKPITLFGIDGGLRNFTYIEDTISILEKLMTVNFKSSFHALNIAVGAPITAKDLALMIASEMNVINPKFEITDKKHFDVSFTWADLTSLEKLIGTIPHSSLRQGVKDFVAWYLSQDSKIRFDLDKI
jgi:UDP-glucuronate 4-epimerase